MKTSLTLRLLTGIALAGLLAGCPEVPPADVLPPAPLVTAFTASAAEVAPGGSVTLTWSVENASEVRIDELKLGAVSGVSGLSGSVDVAITENALFVLTARNTRGTSDTAVVAVRTTTSSTAELLFSSLPSTVSAGEPTTLAWAAPGASSVTITAAPGGAVDLGGQGAVGSLVVTPNATTTYTLAAGGRTATATVTVRPTLVSFSSSSMSADAGATITLSWQTAGATRVQLSAPGRGDLVDTTDAARVASGTFDDTLPAQVDPGQTFPYQLTVTGAGATLTDSVVVSINGKPAVTAFNAPRYVNLGSDAGIALSWTTREADALSVSIGTTEVYRAPPSAVASGSLRVATPAADTTYTVTVTSARGGSASKSVTVDMVGPPSVTLNASPASIAAGDPVSLSWTGSEVRNVRVSSDVDGTLFTLADATDTGTVPGTFSWGSNAVVRIDVDNGAGLVASATRAVTVTNTPQFAGPAGSLRAGEPTVITWTPSTTELTGLPHRDVVTRSPSTGWEDITDAGTALSTSGGDGVGLIPLPGFSAPLMGGVVGNEARAAVDGYLTFSPTNGTNWSSTTLPSAKLEAMTIAPCWADTTATVRYLVRDVTTGGRVLIVQWDTKMQVKVYTTGQVDIEYNTGFSTCSNRGVRGRWGDDFLAIPAAVTATGYTLFGPKTGSATVVFRHDSDLSSTLNVGGKVFPLRSTLGHVVTANELYVSEAMPSPATPLGATGQWFELFNAGTDPVDLAGWTLSYTDGGVSVPLSGTIAPGAVLVTGASADPALNDDAGVQLALAGFTPGTTAGAVVVGRDGGLSTFAWSGATAGTAIINDVGPFRFSTETTGSPRAQTCPATVTFGNLVPAQFGSPGQAGGCGFPYVGVEVPPGYFDISSTGTVGALSDTDNGNFRLSLTAAPVPFFGAARTSVDVSANGFISFDGTARDSTFPNAYPLTTDVNGVAAIFGGSLRAALPGANIYTRRVGQGVDPFAAAPHWIIQWHKWSHNSDSAADLNFQIKLFDDGAIEYHFGAMTPGAVSTRYAAGINNVTWLENATGSQALVLNARSYSPGISPNTAFRFIAR